MKRFPTFFIIIDVASGIAWKLGNQIGNTLSSASENIKLSVFGVNLLTPLKALVKFLGTIFRYIGVVGKFVFIVCIIITILLIIRYIMEKVKYKKMMQKVERMPEPEAMGPIAGQGQAVGVESQGGPRKLDGF